MPQVQVFTLAGAQVGKQVALNVEQAGHDVLAGLVFRYTANWAIRSCAGRR